MIHRNMPVSPLTGSGNCFISGLLISTPRRSAAASEDIHGGKGSPPGSGNRHSKNSSFPAFPPSRDELLVLLARTTKRKVHHYGIEFEHLLYQSTALAPLRSKLARAKHYRTTHSEMTLANEEDIKAGIVTIKYHPGDLSRIWVLDPFSHQYLEILAVDQQYTEDLSLWKHQVIKRAVQEELKSQINHEALVQARTRLQQLITDEMRLTRKIRSRKNMARWWNKQVITWINESTHAERVNDTRDKENLEMQELLAEQETGESASSQAVMPLKSVADLSAPQPPRHSQVVLLSDPSERQDQTPFESFPPLPAPGPSPLKKRTQRGTNKATKHTRQKTAEPTTPPQETHLPLQRQEEQNVLSAKNTSEHSHSPETTSTIDERKQSFAIEARSTRWR